MFHWCTPWFSEKLTIKIVYDQDRRGIYVSIFLPASLSY